MIKKRIFISYDYQNDKHYKNLLTAWDKNDLFDFSFYDGSVTVAVNSTDASYIKTVIKDKIGKSSHFLCIIGADTYKSKWITWEIEKAVELGKKIIAVKTDSTNETPNELYGVGATWAMSFTFDAIAKAIGS